MTAQIINLAAYREARKPAPKAKPSHAEQVEALKDRIIRVLFEERLAEAIIAKTEA